MDAADPKRSMNEVPDPALRQLHWLRFPGALESEFRRDYEAGATTSRCTLMVSGLLLIAVTPLYDVALLRAPEEFVRLSRLLQFGVQIPAILIALMVTLVPRLRRASRAASLLAMMLVAMGLTAQHVIGIPMHFEVPQDFAAVTIAATLFAGRLPLRELAPLALLTMAGTTVLALQAADDSGSRYGAISALMLFLLALIGAGLLEFTARQSWYRGRLLEQLASRDALTGLPNRRYFDRELHLLLRTGAREQRPVALMILDIDHFKAFNDHYGHPLGDDCLRRIGQCLQAGMRRPRDFCARLGGEEFAAVWYDAAPPHAMQLAEQLRMSIDALGIPPAPGTGERVTASAGFVQCTPAVDDDAGDLADWLIDQADDALYRAKRGGRARLAAAASATRRAA